MDSCYDVVIIGAGPAGLTAALYLLRAGKTVAIFEKEAIGGQMAKAPWIENYPGVQGMTGAALADTMMEQVLKYEPELIIEEAVKIASHIANLIQVTGEFGTEVVARNLIVATGGEPISLPILGVDKPHVHYCVTCDGALYAGKKVAVIGGANSAIQFALGLSTLGAEEVHLCVRRNHLRGEKAWIDKLAKDPSIEVHYNFEPVEITDCGVCSGDGQHVVADGVFFAIGYKPNLPRDIGDVACPITNLGGYVKKMRTSPNTFFIGDVREKPFRQIASAVNDGMTAALIIIQQ